MASFVTLKRTNGEKITLNVSMIEWWRPFWNGSNSPDSTSVAYKGGLATVNMTPDEFADLVRQTHADVVNGSEST